MVEWKSHRLKRVVKSTLAAEAAALCEAQDHLEFGRVLLAQMLGYDYGRDWQRALDRFPGYLVMDAKSLFDSLEAPGSMPKERRVALDLQAVREALEREADEARWVPTRHMIADVLTKSMVNIPPYFTYVVPPGKLSVVESDEARQAVPG